MRHALAGFGVKGTHSAARAWSARMELASLLFASAGSSADDEGANRRSNGMSGGGR